MYVIGISFYLKSEFDEIQKIRKRLLDAATPSKVSLWRYD